MRGNTYFDSLGQFDEAISDYKRSLVLYKLNGVNSGSIRASNKGNALVLRGQFDEALKCYRMSPSD